MPTFHIIACKRRTCFGLVAERKYSGETVRSLSKHQRLRAERNASSVLSSFFFFDEVLIKRKKTNRFIGDSLELSLRSLQMRTPAGILRQYIRSHSHFFFSQGSRCSCLSSLRSSLVSASVSDSMEALYSSFWLPSLLEEQTFRIGQMGPANIEAPLRILAVVCYL